MADEAPPPPESPKPRKRWFRFSLRTLLVVFLVASTAPYLYKRIIVYQKLEEIRRSIEEEHCESFLQADLAPEEFGYDLLMEKVAEGAQDPARSWPMRINFAYMLLEVNPDDKIALATMKEGLRAGNARAVELLDPHCELISRLWPDVEFAFVHGEPSARNLIGKICRENYCSPEEFVRRASRLCELCDSDAALRRAIFDKMVSRMEWFGSSEVDGPGFGSSKVIMVVTASIAERVDAMLKAQTRWEKAARLVDLKRCLEENPGEDAAKVLEHVDPMALSDDEDEFVRRASVEVLGCCGYFGRRTVDGMINGADPKAKDIAETGMAGAKW